MGQVSGSGWCGSVICIGVAQANFFCVKICLNALENDIVNGAILTHGFQCFTFVRDQGGSEPLAPRDGLRSGILRVALVRLADKRCSRVACFQYATTVKLRLKTRRRMAPTTQRANGGFRSDLLGVAGGDGTQALVAGICAEHDIPLLVISAGTRNHFALDLGLDRDDPSTCLQALTDGEEVRVDLGMIADRPFVNNAPGVRR